MEDFLPLAAQVSRLINEQTGLEVAEVVPVKRIPKTTSGKVQRHLLAEGYVAGEFDAELQGARGAARARSRDRRSRSRNEIEEKLKSICDAALPGKRLDIHDNLFEVGASSLKLIEIHEQIDREYPGKVDLTELFDFPDHRGAGPAPAGQAGDGLTGPAPPAGSGDAPDGVLRARRVSRCKPGRCRNPGRARRKTA